MDNKTELDNITINEANGNKIILTPERKAGEEQDIDGILEEAGPFGLYQVIIQLSTTFLVLVVSYNNVLAFFTGNDPPWECTGNSSSVACNQTTYTSVATDSDDFNLRCNLNRSEWMFTKARVFSFVTEYELVCGKTSLAALISASFYIGGVLGSFVSGSTADLFGRKPVLITTSIMTTLSSLGCGFVTRIWQLIVLNIIRGAGTYGSFMCCSLFQSEFAPPSYRAVSANILLFAFSCSFFLIDFLAYYVREWRRLAIYASLPCIPLIFFLFFLPESPRWLLVRGKNIRAALIMQKISNNRKVQTHVILKSRISSTVKKYTYADLFRNYVVLKVTLACLTIWFVLPIVYYFINLMSSNIGGDMYQAFALSCIADIPSCLLSAILCNRTGRKRCILGGLAVSGILLVTVVCVPRSLSYRYTITITILILARFACWVAFTAMFTWTSELFPTVVRSNGFFLCALSDRIGVVIVPFITRLLKRVNPSLPFVLVCGLAIGASIVGLILPETNGQPTREVYDDFFQGKSPQPAGDKNNIEIGVTQEIEEDMI